MYRRTSRLKRPPRTPIDYSDIIVDDEHIVCSKCKGSGKVPMPEYVKKELARSRGEFPYMRERECKACGIVFWLKGYQTTNKFCDGCLDLLTPTEYHKFCAANTDEKIRQTREWLAARRKKPPAEKEG